MSLCGGDTYRDPNIPQYQITTFKKFTCLCGKTVNCFFCPKYSVYIRKIKPYNFLAEKYGRIVNGIWCKYDEESFNLLDKSEIYKLPFIEKTGLKYYEFMGSKLRDNDTISTIIMVCDYNCPSIAKCINKLKQEFKKFVQNEKEKDHEEDDIAHYGKISKYKHIDSSKYVIGISTDICHVCKSAILHHRTCRKDKLLIGESIAYPPGYDWRKVGLDYGTHVKTIPGRHMKGKYYLCSTCFIKYG